MRTNSEITTDIALERAAVPQKAESEKLVLGSIMAGYVDFGTIAAIISVDDFSVESRRTIWRVIEQRDLRGESLDRSVVAENLHSIGKLEAAGGLSALLDMEPLNLPKHVEAAARSMRDAAVLRRLYLELDQLALAISEGSTNSTEALGRAEVFVSELAGRLIDSKGLTTVEAAITASGMSPADWLSDCSARAVLENPIVGMRELLDGFRGGELVIIAARPGNGKTALAGQLAETGCSAGVGCAFYSLEMSTSQIISRLVCGRANINSRRLRSGELGRTERQRIAAELGEIFNWPLLIGDNMAVGVAAMRSTLRPLVAAGKVGFIIIDYLGLLVGNSRSENRNQELSEISRGLKRLARELGIPVIALHQLNRDTEKRGGEPRLSDLRDSGSIEQDADVVILIHAVEKDAYQGDYEGVASWRKPCNLIVAKQRNGPTGQYPVEFVSRIARFVEVSR